MLKKFLLIPIALVLANSASAANEHNYFLGVDVGYNKANAFNNTNYNYDDIASIRIRKINSAATPELSLQFGKYFNDKFYGFLSVNYLAVSYDGSKDRPANIDGVDNYLKDSLKLKTDSLSSLINVGYDVFGYNGYTIFTEAGLGVAKNTIITANYKALVSDVLETDPATANTSKTKYFHSPAYKLSLGVKKAIPNTRFKVKTFISYYNYGNMKSSDLSGILYMGEKLKPINLKSFKSKLAGTAFGFGISYNF